MVTAGFKKEYFEGLALIEDRNFWFKVRNQIILWAIKKYSKNLEHFLEIGCGTGYVTSAINKTFPHTKITATDYFAEGLHFAYQRVPEASFRQLDARAIPYDNEFDAIGAFDVLEHIKEDELVLKQMYQALKPQGFLFLTVPQHKWLWSEQDVLACHERRYTVKELQEKTCMAGFKIIRTTSFVTLLVLPMLLSRIRSTKKTNRHAQLKSLKLPPWVNRIGTVLMTADTLLIRLGINLPIGGSRLLIAQKS